MLFADFITLIEWFYDNYMIINPDKCSYMFLGKNNDDDTIKSNEPNLKNSDEKTFLRIEIERS